MTARVRWRGTTTARGYGSGHVRERQARINQFRPGDICPHCGHAIMSLPVRIMPDGTQRIMLDLPHNTDRTGYLPGLAHAYCNRADGARRGNRIRRSRITPPAVAKRWPSSRRW